MVPNPLFSKDFRILILKVFWYLLKIIFLKMYNVLLKECNNNVFINRFWISSNRELLCKTGTVMVSQCFILFYPRRGGKFIFFRIFRQFPGLQRSMKPFPPITVNHIRMRTLSIMNFMMFLSSDLLDFFCNYDINRQTTCVFINFFIYIVLFTSNI